MESVRRISTYEEKRAYSLLRQECGNIIDLAQSTYDSGYGVIRSAEWYDAEGTKYTLDECTIVDKDRISEKFSVPFATSQYHITRRAIDGKQQDYYFNSTTPVVFACDSYGNIYDEQNDDRKSLNEELISWLKLYPRPRWISEQRFKDVVMDYVMSGTAFESKLSKMKRRNKSSEWLVNRIASKNPVLDDDSIKLGILRYMSDREPDQS